MRVLIQKLWILIFFFIRKYSWNINISSLRLHSTEDLG